VQFANLRYYPKAISQPLRAQLSQELKKQQKQRNKRDKFDCTPLQHCKSPRLPFDAKGENNCHIKRKPLPHLK
jgi:hypothetical protein